MSPTEPRSFRAINQAYNTVFQPGQLTLGVVVPIEAYPSRAVPTMADHLERAQRAEELGFAALWLRDVPFQVPSFGDAGQVFDPFVYLGALATTTHRIALGVASIVLPLRHPAHVAKAAASVDVLSGGRLLLGVASGDRPEEYPAMDVAFNDRGERFRHSLTYMRSASASFPRLESPYGVLSGAVDVLPKPTGGRLPLLITGGSRQAPDWVAGHGDGWLTYPRDPHAQAHVVEDYRRRVVASGEPDKPVAQSLYIDLMDDDDTPPTPIHLGFRSGVGPLRAYLRELRSAGVNHVALNLRFNRAGIDETLTRLAQRLFPEFST